ncbi:MAG: hypothetical protein M1819_006208 [Sarea resinae]|nr:MAG: hypothetical protein M1819_006208 [Sarea resinae]
MGPFSFDFPNDPFSTAIPATPTHTKSNVIPFQTPKSASALLDPSVTWAQTSPLFNLSPTIQRSQSLYRQRRASNLDSVDCMNAGFRGYTHPTSSAPNLGLPAVDPSRRLSSSPISSSNTVRDPTTNIHPEEASMSAQTPATPPPTASKRKARKARESRPSKGQSATKMSAQDVTPSKSMAPPNDTVQPSPLHFPSLQFSPDVFGFPMSGSATAPTYPQQRLFWDQNHMDMEAVGQEDPFVTPSRNPGLFQWSQMGASPISTKSSSTSFPLGHDTRGGMTGNLGLDNSDSHDMGSLSFTASTSPQSHTFSPATSGPVDPNLLFSFSDSPNHSLQPAREHNEIRLSGNRLPYQHQLQQSEREKEFKRSLTKGKQVGEKSMAINNPSLVRPGLRRSATDGFMGATDFSTSSAMTDQKRISIQRKSSPLKREGDRLLTAIPEASERQRTAVSFAIDAQGRAKVLVEEVPPAIDEAMQPGDLWNDGESDSSGDTDMIFSRNSSFSAQQPQKQPKLARFTTDAVRRPSRRSPQRPRPASSGSETIIHSGGSSGMPRKY